MTEELSRRQFMRASAAAVAASMGLAGCLGTDEELTPDVPEQRLKDNGWEHADDIENQFQQTLTLADTEQEVGVQYEASIWENDRHLEELPVDAEAVEGAKMQFAGGKATSDPDLGRLLDTTDTAVEEVITQAEKRVSERIQNQPNVENFRRVRDDTVDTVHDGEEAQRYIYRWDITYESFETTVDGQQVTVEAGKFTVESQVLLWIHNGLLAIAGGAYPGKEGTITASREYLGQSRSREVSLGFAPDEYREEVTELARRLD